jgi:hypothetical protein
MLKPSDYDVTNVARDYEVPTVGGHYMKILKVEEMKNKNGGGMIVVAFDFEKPDAQAGLFMKIFHEDLNPDKKYPRLGRAYINVKTVDGKTSKKFKGFCTSVEKSNGFSINWDTQPWGAQFKGKLVGGVFGMVESDYNGKISKRAELRFFREFDKAAEAQVPAERLLTNGSASQTSYSVPQAVPFADDVPF